LKQIESKLTQGELFVALSVLQIIGGNNLFGFKGRV